MIDSGFLPFAMECKTMLVLTRKHGEAIKIGDVEVKVLGIKGNRVLIGIDAPKETNIRRAELKDKAA